MTQDSEHAIGDPVVLAAMRYVTAWVFRPHQRQLGSWRKPPRGMIDASSRAAVIHTFMHLSHRERPFDPTQLRSWALANDWPPDDADIMRDYAQGCSQGFVITPDQIPSDPGVRSLAGSRRRDRTGRASLIAG